MTPQAQRIAIAEACGWTGCHLRNKKGQRSSKGTFIWGKHVNGSFAVTADGDSPYEPIPNYLSDLNAMHEAEKSLPSIFETADYDLQLRKQAEANGTPLWFLSAAQRAEAFLRTLNLWTE